MKKIILFSLIVLSSFYTKSQTPGFNVGVSGFGPNDTVLFGYWTLDNFEENYPDAAIFDAYKQNYFNLYSRKLYFRQIDTLFFNSNAITNSIISNWNTVYGAMNTFTTATNTQTFTNKSGNISQWTNDAGYVTGLSFSSLSGKPTTLSGYGITDPIVLTTNSYSNPSWLTTLAHSKVTYSGATSEYIRGDGSLASFPEIDAIPVGAVVSGIWSSAPDGYLLLRGGTIGDATSGATVFANELMEDLFICLWEHLADSEAPVSGGRGVSAAADWAAHKTITLPDSRQKFILGKATSGTGTTLGGTGGSIDHVHTVDPPNTTSSESANINNVTLLAFGSAASPSHTHDVNINQFNSGVNNPPFISLNFAIKY